MAIAGVFYRLNAATTVFHHVRFFHVEFRVPNVVVGRPRLMQRIEYAYVDQEFNDVLTCPLRRNSNRLTN